MNWELYAIIVFSLSGGFLLMGAWLLRDCGTRRPGDRFGLYSYISLGAALALIGFALFFGLRL